MTPEAQRIAIAEACGWKEGTTGLWKDPDNTGYYPCPNYLSDLNAMHEAEKVLLKRQNNPWVREDMIFPDYGCWTRYCELLRIMEGKQFGGWIHASASARAEAFLRTLGLYQS